MSTQPPSNLQIERLDDIPLLLEHLKRMGIAELIDTYFPVHGNWKGLSLGWTVTIWLTHILSEANHCLSHVQDWVAEHLESLRELTGIETLRALDFSDDRLEAVLRYLNQDAEWAQYEQAQGQNLLRVYELPQEVVRLDSTTASTYQEETPEGLLRSGVSKDHRPDLAQLKVMLATLDPLGLPLATQVVSGNSADDPLYIPAIEQVRSVLNRQGILYVGDCKMAALETRRNIQEKGDYYLTPLPATVVPEKVLDAYLQPLYEVEDNATLLTPVYKENSQGEQELIAEGFECTEDISIEQNGQTYQWTERRLVVRSVSHAKAQETRFNERLAKAEEALNQLNESRRGKKVMTEVSEVESAAQEILKRYRVEGLLELDIHRKVSQKTVRGYAGKASRVERKVRVELTVTPNDEAIETTRRRLGWRVYATTAPEQNFSLEKLTHVYRDQYIIERGNSRLKGKPLSLSPFYLQREDHITGMVRLLAVALSALTLLEFIVREALKEEGTPLSDIYAGNPKRSTLRPSSELLLRAFKNIHYVAQPGAPPIVTPLNSLQRRILKLLGFTEFVYSRCGPIVISG